MEGEVENRHDVRFRKDLYFFCGMVKSNRKEGIYTDGRCDSQLLLSA